MSTGIVKHKRGTSIQWASATYVLKDGEIGIDKTLNKIKVGNGSSLWSALPFINVLPSELTELAQDAVELAITAGTGITKTYNDTANTITLAVDSTIANKNYVDTAVASLGNTSSLTYVPMSDVGTPDGVASLDQNGKIPDSEIPNTIARDVEIPSSTSSLLEGTNLYFTDERAQDAVGNALGNGLSYNDTTGAISVNTSIIASKLYADQTASTAAATAVTNLIDSAPTALDTLNELAAAINDDVSFASTITTALGTKEPTLPLQTGNSGKFLTTNGTSKSWATVDALPAQTDNSGKYLKTNGSSASWSTLDLEGPNLMNIMEAW